MGKNAQNRGSRKAARIAQRKAEGIAIASAKNIRMSPTKVRHVIDLIRGKDYQEAVNILNFTPNIAAEPIRKVVQSAAANAEVNLSLEPEQLYVKACFVDNGFTFKRMHPTTMGRARIIRKRTSHITVQLSERPRLRAARVGGSK
ncbi:MAG TPA: 50S ribosomal protein L22 [Armatimonadota bacterium]|nr:50S ribosomal protein L22 [Armatimonadota bacterium]